MTTLDDDRIDQRLRRAGERLRHEAPSVAATSDALVTLGSRPTPRQVARWVAPAVLAAVAASVIALLLLFARSRDDAVEERSADQPPVSPCLRELAQAHEGRPVDIVTCGGGQPVFGLLPVEPGQETEWFVRSVTGRDVAIELVADDGVTFLFDVPDAAFRPCRIVATEVGEGEWTDACSPVATVRALTNLGGAVYLIGPAADSLGWLIDERADALGCTDLPGLLRAAGEAGGVTVRLSCWDDLAVVVQGSAELATGRAGTWAMALDHTTGQWLVVEQGAALPCTPAAFCSAFGPADDLADVAAPIPRL